MRAHISLGLVVPSALCALVLAGGGCDDGAMHPGGGSGGGTFPDAMVMPDAMGGGGGFVSNTPGATVVDLGGTPGAVLLSSNVQQHPSGGQVFQEWLGEFKNTGATLVCLVKVDVTLSDAAGATVASFSSFAYGDPYMLAGLSLSSPCIAPGKIGSFYDNGFVATAADLTRVTRIGVRFTINSGSGAVAAPHAPQVSSHVEMALGEYDVAGSLTGIGGPIYAIGVTVFPHDASGLVTAYLFDADVDTLQPGGVFLFHTIGTAAAFTDYRLFLDFIDGPKPGVAAPTSPLARAVFDLEMARRAAGAEVRARAAQARTQR